MKAHHVLPFFLAKVEVFATAAPPPTFIPAVRGRRVAQMSGHEPARERIGDAGAEAGGSDGEREVLAVSTVVTTIERDQQVGEEQIECGRDEGRHDQDLSRD